MANGGPTQNDHGEDRLVDITDRLPPRLRDRLDETVKRLHVAAGLHEALGQEHFDVVAEWLRSVAVEHAVEVDGKVISPSVEWLAEAVTEFEPRP